MKKTLLILILLISSISFQGFIKPKSGEDMVKWYTFGEAVELSKKNPKIIMVDIYTTWCGPCKLMDANTFHNPVVAKYINEHFYPVKFNAETRDTVKFNGFSFVNSTPVGGKRGAHDFAISILDSKVMYPSLVFLNEELKRLQIIQGYQEPKAFEPIMKFFGDNAYKTDKWEEFTAKFQPEIK
jgi:thioredoxin-related protein